MNTSNNEDDAERQAFLPRDDNGFADEKTSPETRSSRSTTCREYIRLALEICMVVVILILSVQVFYGSTERAQKSRSPVPDFPQKTYTFNENLKYMNESMFNSREATLKTLHNWVELSATGRGYVQIDNSTFDTSGLSEPYTIDVHSHEEPVYMMSVFHQLHCLSYLVQAYQSAFTGEVLTQELAHHSTHCFDYLRQSIMCNADTTLEGKTEVEPGWGSVHECKDYDAVLKWANEHTVLPWRANSVDTAIL